MPPRAIPADFPTQAFRTSADSESFLEREHAKAPGVYLKLAKKRSGIPSISGAEAVEVALCYGWIDGRANSIDENWWTVRYTPRRAKRLAAVEAAKIDGRWERAYAGPASIVVPDDLKTALADEPAADAYWKSLNKSGRYATLHRLETASAAVRAKKIAMFVQMLAVGQQPGATDAKGKAKATRKQSEGIKKVPSKTIGTARNRQGGEPERPRRAGLRQRNT
ncbi:hypothetical protein N0V83_008249 [Neocucurbitaria cava]|uniref:Bacteriocin-protection, YdeI or OmpD-Associated n=1 Tax=Neocucurbitaria cava TaxID=798079 RepID=A0A9W9CJ99_9PLEO|nr:hypothetical protein N0V83_008249 [Neocucurbitaria cava]